MVRRSLPGARRPLFLACLACLAAGLPASALELLPITEGRLVEIELEGDSQSATPSPDFSDFDASLFFVGAGDASQSSRIELRTLSGSGDSFGDGCDCTSGRSRFDLVFRVDDAATFRWVGELFGDPARFVVELRDPDGVLLAPALTSSHTQFDESGALQPGIDYRLVVEGFHTLEAAGQVWSFSFTVVPEPGTGTLLGLGLAALARAHRRRARAGGTLPSA